MAGVLQILLLCIAGFVFGRRAPIRRSVFVTLAFAIGLLVGFGPTLFIYSGQLPEALASIAPYHVILLGFPWLFASAVGRILRRDAKRTHPKTGANKPAMDKPDPVVS
jgi:hypothetical protein